MPIPPAIIFQAKIAGLAPTPGPDWAFNMASAVASLVNNMVMLTTVTGATQFTFQQAIFAAQLASIAPGPVAAVQAQLFAQAWASAVQASILVVAPGAFMGAPAPPTLFSVVATSLIDPPSIVAAQSALAVKLAAAAPVPVGIQNAYGTAIHDAFLLLTATVTGINSVSPPVGPQPLIAPLCPFS